MDLASFASGAIAASQRYCLLLGRSRLDEVGIVDWHLMAFICIAFSAIGYYLIQFGLLRSKSIFILGIVLLFAAGALIAVTQRTLLNPYVIVLLALCGLAVGSGAVFLNGQQPVYASVCFAIAIVFCAGILLMQTALDKFILLAFCGLATGGGIAFLVVRQPIYAALGFATAILSSSGVLFMQSALFVAAATMIVYAGATIIIFLFVLMFSQQESLETYELKLNRPFMAAIIGSLFLGVLVYSFQSIEGSTTKVWDQSTTRPLSHEGKLATTSSTAALGRSMFTDYLVTVELAGTLLLAATVGAIAVAQRTIEVEP